MSETELETAARHCADQINMHVLCGNYTESGREVWAAIRLSDGKSDGVAYDSRDAAIRHQLHETQCCYIKVPPSGMTPKEAERFINFNRRVVDAGGRMADPDVIHGMPNRLEFL